MPFALKSFGSQIGDDAFDLGAPDRMLFALIDRVRLVGVEEPEKLVWVQTPKLARQEAEASLFLAAAAELEGLLYEAAAAAWEFPGSASTTGCAASASPSVTASSWAYAISSSAR